MQKLRDWMTDMEDRISKMGEIVFSLITKHKKEQTALEQDISEHQVSRGIKRPFLVLDNIRQKLYTYIVLYGSTENREYFVGLYICGYW